MPEVSSSNAEQPEEEPETEPEEPEHIISESSGLKMKIQKKPAEDME